MPTVNTDYIGIIKNVNGRVEFIKENIQHKTALIEELKTMVDNPNRTIFDLQSRMDREFTPATRTCFNYISPYSYSDTYVGGVSYPKAPSYDEYKDELEKSREEYTKKYEDKFASLKAENLQEYSTKVKESVESDMATLVKNKKLSFHSNCKRFCQAYCYSTLLRELKADPDVKMWSTDTVGWTNLSYSITDDIKISIHTNFGYGWSSYFYLGLTYKGIDILPYSMFVKYYYADRRDIARYTRLYATKHESWDYAFDYTETVAHKAAEGDDSFATKYVMNEVQEMLSGLRNIFDNPKAYFDTEIARKNKENESHYLTVRNMSWEDNNKYAAYPEEMLDVFQAEKISGALDFLEKISALEPIYAQATAAADEIRSLAHRLIPQLEKNMTRIAADVERLQAQEDALSLRIDSLNHDIEPHTAIIDELYEQKRSNAEEGKTVYRYTVEDEYSKTHPEYAALVNERNKKSSERITVRNEKSDRQSFHSKLEQCKKDIEASETE